MEVATFILPAGIRWMENEMKIEAEGETEFERFDNTMKKLLSVPHEKIKQALDKENKKKKRRKTTSSASRVSNDRD